MSLFRGNSDSLPRLERLSPPAAMPGGTIELHSTQLSPAGHRIPHATIGDTVAAVTLSRPSRANVQVPEGSISGDLVFHRNGNSSNPLHVRVAVPMAENLHPVANPAVDANGQVFATLSGDRGQAVPVSIFRIQRDFQMTPFVRDLLNPTGLAFDRQGFLYASSRAEGTVYRISPDGEISTYAEGMGIATGIAFDPDGNLYVGDRSGTIFKISPSREIFVFATLEPSVAAYHLAFHPNGDLYVSGPTTSSFDRVYRITPGGEVSVFFRGLGRPQGLAFDRDGNLFVAASYQGWRGIVRIDTQGNADIALSGSGLVGMALQSSGRAILATTGALFTLDWEVRGLPLVGSLS